MDLVKVLAEQQIKNDLPELKVGQTVKVHQTIKEGKSGELGKLKETMRKKLDECAKVIEERIERMKNVTEQAKNKAMADLENDINSLIGKFISENIDLPNKDVPIKQKS